MCSAISSLTLTPKVCFKFQVPNRSGKRDLLKDQGKCKNQSMKIFVIGYTVI